MAPRQPTDEHHSLFSQITVELVAFKSGLRSMQCRVCKLCTARLDRRHCFDPSYLLGEPEVLRQGELPRHRASRSSNSLSRSMRDLNGEDLARLLRGPYGYEGVLQPGRHVPAPGAQGTGDIEDDRAP